MSNEPLYPGVEVQLTGEDGNAFTIVARVRRALERAGHRDAGATFFDEALAGDYDHVLQTCFKYVSVR